MSEKDLIPFTELTEEEQKRLATAGGIASGKVRREKKKIREHLKDFIFNETIEDKDGREVPIFEALIKRYVKMALKDNPRGFEWITENLDGKLQESIKIEPPELEDWSKEEVLEALEKLRNGKSKSTNRNT